MKKKLLLLTGLFVGFFALGYGVITEAYPAIWPYDRNEYYGYWENRRDTAGKYVLGASCSGAYNYWNGQDSCNAFPNWIDTPGEFTSFVIDRYNNGSSTDQVGAAFIILTMIGNSRSWPVSGGEQQEFINRVNALGPYTWWGSTAFSYNLNSYNQRGNNGVGPNDIALYDDSASGHRAFIFRNSGGGIEYVIKTRCANPIGFNTIEPLPDDTNWAASGRSTVSNAAPNPGDTITFNHYVRNNGPTSTGGYVIWSATLSHPSDATLTGGHPTGAYNAGEEKLVDTRNVVVAANTPPGTQICEKVLFDNQSSSVAGPATGAPVCATVQYNFNITPTINAVITSGGVPITGNVAEPGDTITFTYAVNNTGPTSTQNITCTYRQQTFPGNNQSAPATVFTPAGANCPPVRTFPANSNTTTATEASVPAATANTTICRSFTVTPVTQTGGTRTAQSCVLVASKPYARVWGGDISAGNGLANSSGVCSGNNDGAIVGWNKRAPGSNAGAGVQLAAYALARITDFASALYDPGGAPSPNGLSFANTTGNVTNGDFGGGFGTAPCIRDYYATRPTPTTAIPATVAAMTSGVYGDSDGPTGNVTLGGGSIANPNNRVSVYVEGNVMITSNITYSGTWDTDSVPLFELIVKGNIYIDNDVTQLDGVYVAQPNSSGVGGQIHTCATTSNGFTDLPLTSLYTECTRKLTVNGLFTANQIRLLRTNGTLAQSNTSEPSTSPNVAETFNYGPAVWMSQPARQNQGTVPDYDAIISLPPVL